MARLFMVSVALTLTTTIFAQDSYWQQDLNYKIDVTLDDKNNSLKGKLNVVYKNNSPEALDFIWFHIWPNAYKNDSTALFQQLRNDSTSKEDLTSIAHGQIDGLNF